MAVLSFFVHTLCALNFCLPHYQAPAADSSYIELRNDVHLPDSTMPIVSPPTVGSLEGTLMKTIKGRPLAAFMGVPYAEPPVGHLRFSSPVPKKKWDHTLIANQTSPLCLQLDASQYWYITGREDCLYLNIYTPNMPANDGRKHPNLPVIFFIHGGAYYFGGGSDLGPAYLLDHDVILVTVNYRLGVLGFLSNGDGIIPGNNGLKDQAMALKWVQENIEYFGGDKKRITIMGQSAGGSSVNLHLMSDKSKDIPYAAIMHSGNALMEWSMARSTVNNSRLVAESFECPTNDSQRMLDCLRSQNPYFIVARTLNTFKAYFFPSIPFGPVVEPEGQDAFLTQEPRKAYEDGNVKSIPTLAGTVENEGDLFTYPMVLYPGVLSGVNRRWFEIAPLALDFYRTAANPTNVSMQIRDFYFGNESISFHTRDSISKMMGDRYIMTGAKRGLQYHSTVAPTYGYHLTYKGRYSVAHGLALNPSEWGVTHFDDISYLMNSTLYFSPMKITDPEFTISEFMTNVWANFVTNGKPTYIDDDGNDVDFWKPIEDPNNIQLIEINKHVQQIPFPFKERLAFWDSLDLSDNFKYSDSKRPDRPEANSIL